MRRVMFGVIVPLVAIGVSVGAATRPGTQPTIQVYSSASCGCCTLWTQHLRASGFQAEVTHLDDLTPVKVMRGVPAALEACHTAVVEGYVIEGHVPAADIQRLLKERPNVAGLAVRGMPVGSPGMEGPNPVPYDVLTFDRSGRTTVFSSHGR